jgi:hypothetical protein
MRKIKYNLRLGLTGEGIKNILINFSCIPS